MLGIRQIELFQDEKVYASIDKHGDALAKLDSIMDWEPFVTVIDTVRPNMTHRGKGGRPPIPNLVMLKSLLISELYHLSDEQTEYQINDRVSFKRFCGLSLTEAAPDEKSIWALREKLKETGRYEDLFKTLLSVLADAGLQYSKCALVDASFVDAPRRRNLTREQNAALKEHKETGAELPLAIDKEQIYSLESHLPEADRTMTHKLRQTDLDATWAKKGEETHFGYKDHVAVDAETKIIVAHTVTAASVADCKELVGVVPEGTERVYDDSGYTGVEYDRALQEKCPEIEHFTAKKAQRNKPLTKEQKKYNRDIVSSVRVRCEHVFGHITYCMGGLTVRCIGIERAHCKITLRDFAYNLQRYATLFRLGKARSLISA